MSCSLTLSNVTIARGSQTLCSGLTLNLGHKEKIAIVGANGCGKTTLLESIVGLQRARAGTIELFHQPISRSSDFKAIRHDVGYLLQDSDEQFLSPIVEDDVAFGLLSRGVGADEARERTAAMLESLGISHLAKKVVYHLSGGQKKLVALAGVLITEPKLMLLDEPTSGLDPKMQLRLSQILRGIDKSVVIVSHDMDFIDAIVDRTYLITPTGLQCVKGDEYVHSHDGLGAHAHPHEH
jgi:cobalt/nickel transport system ATP-binding protein